MLLTFILATVLALGECSLYPVYSAHGDYYNVGYQIGKQAAPRIAEFLSINPDINTMKEYIQTSQGSREYAELRVFNEELYPNYFVELYGIADGSGIDFNDILLINFEYELDALMAQNNYSTTHLIDSCSDLFVYNNNVFIGHGHNEDDWNGSLSTAYFTNITYTQNNNKNKDYNIFGFSFLPGILPSTSGPALSLTNSITLTINYLFPINVSSLGKATAFICRTILESKNINDAIKAITDGVMISVGASFNIGQYDNTNNKYELFNVELYNTEYSVLNIQNLNYSYHFNTYQRLLNISQYPMLSSDNRMNRTIQIINDNDNGTLSDIEQVINILGDTENQEYPIWRTGYISTLLTTLYDLQNGIAYFYEYCDPKNCTPAITVKL